MWVWCDPDIFFAVWLGSQCLKALSVFISWPGQAGLEVGAYWFGTFQVPEVRGTIVVGIGLGIVIGLGWPFWIPVLVPCPGWTSPIISSISWSRR